MPDHGHPLVDPRSSILFLISATINSSVNSSSTLASTRNPTLITRLLFILWPVNSSVSSRNTTFVSYRLSRRFYFRINFVRGWRVRVDESKMNFLRSTVWKASSTRKRYIRITVRGTTPVYYWFLLLERFALVSYLLFSSLRNDGSWRVVKNLSKKRG